MKISTGIIAALFFCLSAKAQWTSNPSVNTPSALGNEFVDPIALVDSEGNTLISYRFLTGTGSYGVKAQKLDAAGVPQWGTGGLVVNADDPSQTFTTVYTSTVDRANNLLTTFQDSRTGDWDVFISKVNANGTLGWGTAGVQLSYGISTDVNPHVLAMPDSTTIIAWQTDDSTGIRLQRLTYDGTKMWGQYGILHHYQPGDLLHYYGYPELVLCNDTSFYLLFKKANASFNASQQKFSMMKFGVSSQELFAGDIDFQSIGGIPNISYIKALSDGAEGVVMGWLDSRVNNFYLDGFVQHTDPLGNPLLTPDGVSVSALSTSQELGDIQIAWMNNTIYAGYMGTLNAYMQAIDATGSVLIGSGGMSYTTTASNIAQINLKVADGNLLFTYDESSFPNDEYSAVIFDPTLTLLSSFYVANGSSTKSNATLTDCKNSQAVLVWQDSRNSGVNNIYAQNINSDGSLGVGVSEINDFDFAAFPNPASSELNIRSFIPAEKVMLTDITGKIVALESGSAISRIDVSALSNGTYFLKVISGTKVSRKAIVIAR